MFKDIDEYFIKDCFKVKMILVGFDKIFFILIICNLSSW